MIFMHHFLLEELTQNGEVSGIQVVFFLEKEKIDLQKLMNMIKLRLKREDRL